MSRLQKKCFVGATTAHGLLLLALLVGPAFFRPKPPESAPILIIEPDLVTVQGNSGTPPPVPEVQPQPPQITQPQPPPPEPTPEPTPEPKRPDPKPVEQPQPKIKNQEAPPEKKTSSKPHEIKVSKERVRIPSTTSTKPTTATTQPTTSANTELTRALTASRNRVRDNLSPTTQVDLPVGQGNSGPSAAEYGQLVRKRYTDAWIVPDNMTDDDATIKVSVSIARNGRVLSARIVQASSSSAANRSIQNTLDRITEIGRPFPSEMRESEWTFILTFNLKVKKAFG